MSQGTRRPERSEPSDAPRRAKGVAVAGEVFLRRRTEKRLTRTELAALASVTTKTIQRAEEDGPLTPSVIRQLCTALGLPFGAVVRASPAECVERLRASGRGPSAPPSPWIERAPEVARALEKLGFGSDGARLAVKAGGPRRVVLAGPPGIGKTAIAQQVVALVAEHFPDGVAWIDGANVVSRPAREEAQRAIAAALGFDAILPATGAPRELDQAFREAFWSRPRLLVIDDLRFGEVLEAFAPSEPSGALLITTASRRAADRVGLGAIDDMIEVGPVPPEVARRALEMHIAPAWFTRNPTATERVLAMVAGAPGSIHSLGQLVKREPFIEARDVVQRMEDKGLRDALEDERGLGAEWWEQTLIDGYQRAQSRLSPSAWGVMAAVSILGTEPFMARRAAKLSALPLPTLSRCVSELFDAFIVRLAEGPLPDGAETLLCLDPHAVVVARVVLGREEDTVRARARLLTPAIDVGS